LIEFIAGLVLGALLGVVADRIWERIEKRPKLELTLGYFQNRDHEEGLNYKVRNVGSSEVPEFQIVVWHPKRGSMSVFNSKDNGPLLPDQTREYRCILFKNGVAEMFLKNWISREENQIVDAPKFDQFKLLVKMLKSERVLFESGKMGNALAEDWHRSLVLNKPGKATWADHQAMSSPPPFGLKYWLERRREKKELDKIVAKHKKSDNNPMDRSGGSAAS